MDGSSLLARDDDSLCAIMADRDSGCETESYWLMFLEISIRYLPRLNDISAIFSFRSAIVFEAVPHLLLLYDRSKAQRTRKDVRMRWPRRMVERLSSFSVFVGMFLSRIELART